MDAIVTVDQVSELPVELERLVAASVRESHFFLERLRDERESGENRFGKPGEAFFVAHVDRRLVGVCGLNRDPYTSISGIGRLRHLYIVPEFRRQGVGRCLVSRALMAARDHFSSVRLRTQNPTAAKFYEALGFASTGFSADATHELVIRR